MNYGAISIAFSWMNFSIFDKSTDDCIFFSKFFFVRSQQHFLNFIQHLLIGMCFEFCGIFSNDVVI